MLDAMGVIYAVGDDVRYLLRPFIAEKGGIRDADKIQSLYDTAVLGRISASELWEGVDLNPEIEDEYLQRYKLTDGLIGFLEAINHQGVEVWCLSNDLSEWSRKLRIRFGLDKYFRCFVVSGDVGVGKPDRAIFEHLIRHLNVSPCEVVFVDDKQRNLDAAAEIGFDTILFAPADCNLTDERHQVATTFNDILSLLSHGMIHWKLIT